MRAATGSSSATSSRKVCWHAGVSCTWPTLMPPCAWHTIHMQEAQSSFSAARASIVCNRFTSLHSSPPARSNRARNGAKRPWTKEHPPPLAGPPRSSTEKYRTAQVAVGAHGGSIVLTMPFCRKTRSCLRSGTVRSYTSRTASAPVHTRMGEPSGEFAPISHSRGVATSACCCADRASAAEGARERRRRTVMQAVRTERKHLPEAGEAQKRRPDAACRAHDLSHDRVSKLSTPHYHTQRPRYDLKILIFNTKRDLVSLNNVEKRPVLSRKEI